MLIKIYRLAKIKLCTLLVCRPPIKKLWPKAALHRMQWVNSMGEYKIFLVVCHNKKNE